MKNMFRKLWNDDAGFIVSGEIVFLFTITVIGLVIGWVHVRNAVVSELTDIANAIAHLDQTYSFPSLTSSCAGAASTGGANFVDGHPAALDITGTPVATATNSSVDACLP